MKSLLIAIDCCIHLRAFLWQVQPHSSLDYLTNRVEAQQRLFQRQSQLWSIKYYFLIMHANCQPTETKAQGKSHQIHRKNVTNHYSSYPKGYERKDWLRLGFLATFLEGKNTARARYPQCFLCGGNSELSETPSWSLFPGKPCTWVYLPKMNDYLPTVFGFPNTKEQSLI